MKKVVKYFSICLLAIISCCLFSACGSNIKLKINFDSNGGTNCSAIYYEVGKNFNMPSDPTKENYIFDGWYEDNGTWEKPFTVNTILNYPLSKSVEITAYAKWLQVNYNIVFNSNGGDTCEDLYVEELNEELPTPQKSGYSFAGWYLDNTTFEKSFTLNTTFELDEQREITIYAKWTRNLKVVYHLNNDENDIILFYNGNSFPFPDSVKRECFSFVNWSFNNNINVEFNINQISEYENEGQLDLYAMWREYQIFSAEMSEQGNLKDLYDWGEEIDFSQTLIKLTYTNGKSRIVNLTDYQNLDKYGNIAKYDRSLDLYSAEFNCDVKLGTYFPKNIKFLIVPATIYLDITINIKANNNIVGVENYNEFINYNDDDYVLFDENSTIIIQENDEDVYVNIFEAINSGDLIYSEIDKSISLSFLNGHIYYTSFDKINGFINNKAYINKSLVIRYKTAKFTLNYKIIFEEIEEINFYKKDFYSKTVKKKLNIGGIYGGVYPDYYRDRLNLENVTLTEDGSPRVQISVKFKNNDFNYINYVGQLFESYEIINDIQLDDDENATATIMINNTTYNLEINLPIYLEATKSEYDGLAIAA